MRVVRLLLKTTGTGSRWRAIVMIHKMVLIYNHYIHLNTYLGSSVNVLLIPLVPWMITNATNRMEYCWSFIITEQWLSI